MENYCYFFIEKSSNLYNIKYYSLDAVSLTKFPLPFSLRSFNEDPAGWASMNKPSSNLKGNTDFSLPITRAV